MNITKTSISQSWKQGSLVKLFKDDITAKLGFAPEGLSGDEKSEHQWEFTVEGVECSIWDWHGGGNDGNWSYYGPAEVFAKLFGQKHLAV